MSDQPRCDDCNNTGVYRPPGSVGGAYDDSTQCRCFRKGGVNYEEPEPRTGTLFEVLRLVGTAPPTQLRPDMSARARRLHSSAATTPEEVHAFFSEVWLLTDTCASSFVRAMVDPRFTKGYA